MSPPLVMLVAASDSDYRGATVELLKSAGHTVMVMETIADALGAIKAVQVDLVLLAGSMPDGAPDDACRMIKSDPETASVFTVVVSDRSAPEESRGETRTEGADATLTTRLTPEELLGRMDAFVRILQAENKLRKAEVKYRQLAEASPDFIYLMDRKGCYLSANSRLEQRARETGRAAVGAHLSDIYPPDVATMHMEQLERVEKSGQMVEFEHDLHQVDGVHRYHHLLYPVFKEGKPWAIGGICRDITHQAQAEALVKESERKYRLFFDHVLDVVFSLNADFTLAEISPSIEKALGYRPKELVGNTILSHGLVADRSLAAAQSALTLVAAGEEIAALAIECVHRDGSRRFGEVSLTPSKKSSGETAVFGVWRDTTEKQAAMAALLRSQEMLVETERTARVGGWEYQVRAGQLQWTPMASRIHNVSEHESITLAAFIRLYTPEDRDRIEAALDQGGSTGAPWDLELRLDARRGGQRWIRMIGKAQVDGGKVVRLYGTVQDIDSHKKVTLALKASEKKLQQVGMELEQRVNERTGELQSANTRLAKEVEERAASQTALVLSEQRYRTLFDNLAVGLTVLEPQVDGKDFMIVDINAKALEIAIAGKEAIVGRSAQKAFPGIEQMGLLEAIQQVHQTGTVRRFPMAAYHDPWIRIWVQITVFRLPAGEVVVMYSDESQRHLAEDGLRASEAQMRLLMNSTVEAIFGLDEQGRVTFANASCLNLLGYERTEELSGQFMHELVHHTHPDGRRHPKEDCPILRVLRNAQMVHVSEDVLWCKDGTALPVSYRAHPVMHNTTIAGAVVSFLDITQQQQMAREKSELEMRLRNTQKMESIGTLAGGIAHDFNNILGAIIGFGEMIELFNAPDEGDLQENIAELLKAAYRAKSLVKQILVFSRHGGKEKEPLALEPIVKETIQFIRATLPTSIEIRSEIDNLPAMVTGDATQIQQVVMNLCTNAAHAIGSDGGIIQIRLSAKELDAQAAVRFPDLHPGRYARLAITDDGGGIVPEIQDRIFEPYFTTKETGEGTGMGLAVSHGIVQHHGGEIFFESRPGQGVTFFVLLPLTAMEREATLAKWPEPLEVGAGRILLVDDEAALIQFASKALDRLGYAVTSESDSSRAFERFKADPSAFDIVITDQTMPGLSGLDLAEQIKAARPALPVVLCTGFSETVPAERMQNVGVDAMISKPIGIRELSTLLNQLLGPPHEPNGSGNKPRPMAVGEVTDGQGSDY